MKKLIALILTTLLVLSCMTACASGKTLADVQKAGKLTIATSPDFPPFEYLAEDGSVVGIEIDYTDMAEQVDSIRLYGNGYAFRDVVDRDGEGDSRTHFGVIQSSDEGRDSFREVVDSYGQGGKKAESVHGLFVSGLLQHADCRRLRVKRKTRCFMRVFILRDSEVDECDETHADKERDEHEGFAMSKPCAGDHLLGFGKHLGHGDEYHDSCAESEGSREEVTADLLLEEYKRAADTGRRSGDQCQ